MPDIALEHVTRTYGEPPGEVHALRGVDLTIRTGEFVSVIGPSGAGKSTVLNLVTLLDAPTTGRVRIDGTDPATLGSKALARLRSATFGFVFQGFHLMEAQTVLENVALGVRYRHLRIKDQERTARAALDQVGLLDRAGELARNLSGGQRQRVAIARALVAGAPVLVADEPTGNLDSESAGAITGILQEVARTGRTVIIVTHDSGVAAVADRTVAIRDGLIESDAAGTAPGSACSEEGGSHAGAAREDAHASSMTAIAAAEPPETAGTAGLTPVGRDSSLSFPDLVRDAWAGLASVPSRMMALVLAVALGVGLATATLGLASSASAQVSATFDAQRNRQVGVGINDADQEPAFYVERAGQVRGIDAVGAEWSSEDASISYRDAQAEPGTPLSAVTANFAVASQQEITWIDGVDHLEDGQALIGASLAENLQLGPLFTGPIVLVNGIPLTVVGIIEESSLEPPALRGITITDTDPARENPLLSDAAASLSMRVLTAPGAAQQVGSQLPLALDPLAPETIVVNAPPDPSTSRAQIESTVATTLTVLSAVAVLAAVISLMSSMSMSVMARTREFGLRRALGARAAHLRYLVLTEAFMIGVAGGVAGLFLGLLGVLGTSIVRGWAPVFDPLLAPVAIGAGIVVAMLAGMVAGRRAGRIQPVEALRL